MKTLILFFFTTSLFLISPLTAKLTLEECQMAALKNGEKKNIADIASLIAYDRIDEARSSGRPRVFAQADYTNSGDGKHWRDHKNSKHARLSLVIPVCNFGVTREAVKAQTKNYESSLYSNNQIEQDILYAVNTAYFELLIYQKVEWIVQDSIRILEGQLQITNDFLAQGLLHRNEVLVLEVQLAQLQQDIMEAHYLTEIATSKLNRLMGLDLNTVTEIEDLLPTEQQEDRLEDFIEAAKCNHPTLHALQLQMEAANHAYKAEKATLYPNVYAFSNYSSTSDYALPYKQGLDGGIGLEFSFYDGGSTYAKLRRMKKELCEIEWRYQELENDLELNIRSAYLAIKTALGKIPVALKGVDLAEENLGLTRSLFEEGLVTNVDVINDEESFSQARLNYYKSLYNFHQSRANLIYSAGLYKIGCH